MFGKRSDGKRVKQSDPMLHVMPYVMRGRNESAVYYKTSICIDEAQAFIVEKRREGRRITLFNLIVAALLQTVHRRPHLNRYVRGRRVYERPHFEVTYVVKQTLTDDGLESLAKVVISPDDDLEAIAQKMRAHIEEIKQGTIKDDDRFFRLFTHTPRWFMRLVATLLRWLDFNGLLPRALVDVLPFYSTIFLSHLGSLGAEAPFHHLYEFGTNSIFMTVGRTYQAPYKAADGGVEWKKTLDLAFTLDERICDGFYLIRSLKLFEQFMSHPHLLDYPASAEIDVNRSQTWPQSVRSQKQKESQRMENTREELKKVMQEPTVEPASEAVTGQTPSQKAAALKQTIKPAQVRDEDLPCEGDACKTQPEKPQVAEDAPADLQFPAAGDGVDTNA